MGGEERMGSIGGDGEKEGGSWVEAGGGGEKGGP